MGFFDSFTGGSQRRDIAKADKRATSMLERGYGQQQQAYDAAGDYIEPYAADGRRAADTYNAFLGLKGQDAAQGAYDNLAALPAFQGQLAAGSNAILKNMNARGAGAGGSAAIAGQRVLQENIGNWMDRYRSQGQQGFEAAGMQADLSTARGDNAYGYGATRAGQAINRGNAMAEARTTGINNILNLAGTVANAASGFRMPKVPR